MTKQPIVVRREAVSHTHTLEDGTERTHTHIAPWLHHRWQLVRPVADDDGYVIVESNVWHADPYGATMAAFGQALEKGTQDSGMMNDDEWEIILEVIRQIDKLDPAVLSDRIRHLAFHN